VTVGELYVMHVELPKSQADLLRVCKALRLGYNAFHEDNEITTSGANELAMRVVREGPLKFAESANNETLEGLVEVWASDAPEITAMVNPSDLDLLNFQPGQEVAPQDAPDEALDVIQGEFEHQGALVALALMGAVEGDPVQATGLAAMLGGITGHEAFREAVVLLGQAYQIEVVSNG
jgi:hypothetical protein